MGDDWDGCTLVGSITTGGGVELGRAVSVSLLTLVDIIILDSLSLLIAGVEMRRCL